MTPRNKLEAASHTIRAELEPRLEYFRENNKLIEAQRLKERTQYDLEMIQQLGYATVLKTIRSISLVVHQGKRRRPYLTIFQKTHCCSLMSHMSLFRKSVQCIKAIDHVKRTWSIMAFVCQVR